MSEPNTGRSGPTAAQPARGMGAFFLFLCVVSAIFYFATSDTLAYFLNKLWTIIHH
jgi:hypothetical protein